MTGRSHSYEAQNRPQLLDLGQRIVAYVVGSAVDETALIEHVARQLSVHKRPREIRAVEALPRNAMGKVQKTLLRD